MVSAEEIELKVKRGSDFSFDVEYSIDDIPEDLVDASFIARAYRDSDAPLWLSADSGSDNISISGNKIMVRFPAGLITFQGDGYYELKVSTSSDTGTLMEGPLIAEGSIR